MDHTDILDRPVSAEIASASKNRFWLWSHLAAVVAIVWSYRPAVLGPFLMDDWDNIVRNPTLDSLRTALMPAEGSFLQGRPVANLFFAIQKSWLGLQPEGFHAVSVVLHCVTFIILSLFAAAVVRRIQSEGGPLVSPDAVGLMTGLLWAVHPVQTETVNYISQQTEALAACFAAISLLFLMRGQMARHSWTWFGGSFLFLALGLGVKETLIVVPLLQFVLVWVLWGGELKWNLRRSAPVILASVVVCAVVGVRMLHVSQGGTSALNIVGGWNSFMKGVASLGAYARLAFFPHPLIFDRGASFSPSGADLVVGVAVLTLGLLGLAVRRIWALGLAAFLILLAPTTLVSSVSGQAFAEHRLYLPLFFLILFLVSAFAKLLPRAVSIGLFCVLCVALGVTARERSGVYASELSLVEDTIAKVPDVARLHLFHAEALVRAEKWAEAETARRSAAEAFRRDLKRNPDDVAAASGLGLLVANFPDGDEEAEHCFRIVVKKDPTSGPNWLMLGNVLSRKPQGIREALECYRKAAGLMPNDLGPRLNLAQLEGRLPGKYEQAVAEYRALMTEFPNDTRPPVALAELIAQTLPDWKAPWALLNSVLRQDPNQRDALYLAGYLKSFEAGKNAESGAYYRRALTVDPRFLQARYNLALAFAEYPSTVPLAVFHLKQVLAQDPQNPYAPIMLGRLR